MKLFVERYEARNVVRGIRFDKLFMDVGELSYLFFRSLDARKRCGERIYGKADFYKIFQIRCA